MQGQKQELYVIWWVIMVGCDRCNSHWFYAWEAYLTAIIIIHLEYQGDCKEEWELDKLERPFWEYPPQ